MVRMDIQQMRAFLAVAQELHFGRAAEHLHMAQPALSRMIRALEQELGANLFQRSTRQVRLTSAGEALLGPAGDLIDTFGRAQRAVISAGKGQSGRIRVAFAGASTDVMVGKLAKVVRRTHPGIDFELYSSNYAGPAMDKVVSGAMEIGLGRWDSVPPGIGTRVLANEHLVIAVPARHRLASARSIPITEMRNEPLVTLPPHPGSVLEDRLRRFSYAAGFTPNIVQVAPDSWTLTTLVAAEIGCSLTLSSVAMNINNPDVVFIPLAGQTEPVQLKMAWRQDNTSPALQEVLRIAVDVLPTPSLPSKGS